MARMPARFVNGLYDTARLRTQIDSLLAIRTASQPVLSDSVQGASLREDQEYDGVRITLTARLGNARIPMQIDIGFGDAITPSVEAVEFPLLLTIPALPAAKLNAYPRETVIAEKLEAMVALGMANSRMKDFYDLFTLAQNFPFDGTVLVRAVQNTFERRATPLPDAAPIALTDEFSGDAAKTSQWRSFLKRVGIHAAEPDLAEVIDHLRQFLLPVLATAKSREEFQQNWNAGKSWRAKPKQLPSHETVERG